MFRFISGILSILVFLYINPLTGQCLSKEGRSKLMPLGVHLMGLQKKQDTIQLAILSTTYMCIEQGDKSNIEFNDGTYIYLSNLLELNCDGKAYFNLSKTDMLALGTKEVTKVVLGSKFKGYTATAIPVETQSMEFRNLVNCIINEETLQRVALDSQALALQTTSSTQSLSESTKLTDNIASNLEAKFKTPATIEPPILPFRYIQFIATSGGKAYNELSYLGTVISEQVPNKNLFRYKLQGRFTDADIKRIITSLAAEGFTGAFEFK